MTGGADEAGFSLIEIMVAMLVFAVLAVAALGFLISSLSSTALARTETVAKNLNQELLESMRNLPYSVHANVSTVPDLLDTYYVSTLTPAANTASSGFVSAGGPRDTAQGDPATGPFYRRVLPAPADYPGFTRRVTAQFLDSGTTVLAAPAFVSTSPDSAGLPPSSTLGVRVTTLWPSRSGPRSFTVESQITDAAVEAPLVTLQARVALLRVTGRLPDTRELVAEAGVLNLDGSLSSTTVGSAVARSAQASVADGNRVEGATGTLAAPPAASLEVGGTGARTLTDAGELAFFEQTSVRGLRVSTDDGQPKVGNAAHPVTAVVHGPTGGGTYFWADPGADASHLGLTGPVVRASAPSCGGECDAARSSGRLASTGGSDHSATATLDGALQGTVALFPTATSPDGLVQVTLSSLSVVCQSRADQTPAGQASVSYTGSLRHRTWSPETGYGYSPWVSLSAEASTDPLGQIDLQTVVGQDSAGYVLRLSHYIQSWSSVTSTAVAASTVVAADGSTAGISMPGVLTLTSMPVRNDPTSTFGLQLGAISCTAGDIR